VSGPEYRAEPAVMRIALLTKRANVKRQIDSSMMDIFMQ